MSNISENTCTHAHRIIRKLIKERDGARKTSWNYHGELEVKIGECNDLKARVQELEKLEKMVGDSAYSVKMICERDQLKQRVQELEYVIQRAIYELSEGLIGNAEMVLTEALKEVPDGCGTSEKNE